MEKTDKNSAKSDLTSYMIDSVTVKYGSCPKKKYSLSVQEYEEYLKHHNGF